MMVQNFLSFYEKEAKNPAKGMPFRPSERHKKTKKISGLTRGGNLALPFDYWYLLCYYLAYRLPRRYSSTAGIVPSSLIVILSLVEDVPRIATFR